MLPSPAELTYFLEVASVLNISRAAERLGLSQPSLSLALKRLEGAIGIELFVRHKNGVTLTQAGKQLLIHARELLNYWEKTRSEALASQQKIQGCFRLGFHSSIAIYLGSFFLPDLMANYPKLEIHLRHEISRRVTEEVINLSLDIGIVVNPIKHPDLIIRKLFEDEVTFWSASPGVSKKEVYATPQIVLCDLDLVQAQTLLKQIRKMSSVPPRIMTSNSLEVIAALTTKKCGIGILPTRVAQGLYAGKLHKISYMPVFADEICLIYRQENREVQAVQTIIEAILAAV
jgi:DNA-binding transcriptional LysR family regulator